MRCVPALLLLLAALAGCDRFDRAVTGLPPAQGPVPDVHVVADSATFNGPVGRALQEVFSSPLGTLPNRQGPFRINRLDPESRLATRARRFRLVVYAAPIDQPGRLGDFVRSQFSPSALQALRAGRAASVVAREDVWASGQVVVTMTAATQEALALQILRKGPELLPRFNRIAREATAADIFGRYRQTDLEADMRDRLGVSVHVQYDYVKAQDTTVTVAGRTGEFVRYRRVLTDTWRDYFLFVQDGVAALPDSAALDALTDGLLETFARGSYEDSFVQMDPRRPVTRDAVEIGGRPALEKRGLWLMTNDLMGGSYLRYATIVDGRLVLFYGMTFAPDRALDKREFLRQLEATAYTLRSAREAAADAPG